MDPREDIGVASEPVTKAPKKKKKHIGLWISLLATFFFIVAPIATIFICFYDGTRANIQREEGFSAETMFRDTTFNALEGTDDGYLDFIVSKDQFNQALAATLDSITKDNAMLKDLVQDISLETDEKEYRFVLDVNLKGVFKTRVYLITEYTEGEIEGKGDCLIFNIKTLKLGRVAGVDGLINKFAPGLLNDNFIQGLFSNFGFSFVSDLANKRIYYPRSQFRKDITSKVSISSKLFECVIKMFFKDEVLSLGFKPEGFKASVNLEHFATNSTFITNEKKNDVDWDAVKKTTTAIINGISMDAFGPADVYDFVINGNYRTPVALKEKFKTVNLVPYGIADFDTYNGIWCTTPTEGKIYVPTETLKDHLGAQINPTDIDAHKIGVITEARLNETLMSSDAIGEAYTLTNVGKDGKTQFVPMTITNMYANIVNDGIRLVITVSVNGYDTNICIDAKFDSFEPGTYDTTFALKIDRIFFGEELIDDEFGQAIFELIKRALDIDETFNFNIETKEIKMNFLSAIEDSGYKALIDLTGTPALTLTGDSLASEGTLEFVIIPA